MQRGVFLHQIGQHNHVIVWFHVHLHSPNHLKNNNQGLYFNPPNGNFACAFLDYQDYLLIILWIRWICCMRLPKISISIIFCMSQNKIKPHELFVNRNFISNHMTELNFVKKCWVLLIIDKMCRDIEKCQYKMHSIKHNNTHLSSINLSWELKKHPINRPPIRIKSCI